VIKEKSIPGYKPAYTGLVDVARKTWKINGAKAPFQGRVEVCSKPKSNNSTSALYETGSFSTIARRAGDNPQQ
jgi:hypothetical protein